MIWLMIFSTLDLFFIYPEYRVHFCRPVAEGPLLELEIQPFSEILRCFIFAHYYIQLHTKIIDKGECIVTKSQSVVTWGQRLFIWYWLIRLVIYCFNSSSLVFDFGWNKDEDSDFAADFRSLSCHDFLFVIEIHLNLNSHTGGWYLWRPEDAKSVL